MFVVARTPAALYRQLRAQGRSLEEQQLVRRAIELDIEVYSARFEPDGTPFQVHGIGTASVMSQMGAPIHVVAAAILHNAFQQGDWADGRGSGAYAPRRERVRAALGAETEELITAIQERPRQRIDDLDAIARLAPNDRWRLLLRIGDILDKWDDGRVMYSGDGRGDRRFVAEHSHEILEIARRFGSEEFAESLECAFATVAAETIPESMKSTRTYSAVIPPASYQRRPVLAAKYATYAFLRRVRRGARRRLRARLGR
jgi:hypothetical protein